MEVVLENTQSGFYLYPMKITRPTRLQSLWMVGFLVISLISIISIQWHQEPVPVPTDTKVIHKDDGEDEEWQEIQERQAYIEEIHKSDSSTNWRKVDQLTRIQRYNSLPKARSGITEETVANGHLTGTWTEKGSSNQSGRVMYADYDTATQSIYVGAAGGQVFKGTKNGNNWTPLNEKLNFGSIDHIAVLNMNAPRRLFVAAGKFCYYSDNDGVDWNVSTGISNVQDWGDIQKAVVLNSENEEIYLLIQEWDYVNWGQIMSIYHSTDRGESFSKLFSVRTDDTGPHRTHDIWADRYQDTVIHYLQQDAVYTVDNGSPQALGNLGIAVNSRAMITGSNASGNTDLYAFIDQDIYHSTDGQSWTFQSNVGRNEFRRNSFAASYSNSQSVFFGGVNCARSDNAFAQWSEVNEWYEYYGSEEDKLHADIPAVIPYVDENGNYQMYICTDGGLYRSSDNLMTVENLSLHGLNCSQYYDVYTNRNNLSYIYNGSQDQGFQMASQDTAAILGFEQTVSGDYAHIVSSDSGSSIWFEYPGFVAYKNDATTNDAWTISGDFDNRNNYWLPPLREHPSNKFKAYMAGTDPITEDGAFIYEMDASALSGDIVFNPVTSDLSNVFGQGKISSFCFSPIQPNFWYALTSSGRMIYSSDNMNSWNLGGLNNGPEDHYFHGSSVYASKTKLGRVFAAGSGYNNPGAWVSEDHGATWEAIISGLPSTLTYMITATPDDSLVFAATEIGPYVFVAKDSIWYPLDGNGAPDVTYWSVEWIDQIKTVRFGTYGRGIWDFAITQDTVSSDTGSATVSENTLKNSLQIFPNPAVNQVNLNLSWNGEIEIHVFNINGQLTENRALLLENNNLTWDVSNYPSGTYIIQIRQGDKIETSRLVIL